MSKLEEMKRIMYENYNEEELLEYYKRKVLILKQNNADINQILFYLNKIEDIETTKNKEDRQK